MLGGYCRGCNAVAGARRQRRSNFDSRSNSAVVGSLLAGLLCVVSGATQGRSINAVSPSLSDVKRAIAAAADGDIVIIPAGTAAWTSALAITKGITIQGQTTTNSDNGKADDQTVLVDNLASVRGDQGFFHCTTNRSKSLRITGITFTGVGGRSSGTYFNGAIRLSGTSNQVRIDHCHFTALKQQPNIAVYSTIYGVADHNVFEHFARGCQSIKIFNGTGYGDLEFSQAAGWGNSNFFFVEDCYLNNGTPDHYVPEGGIDAAAGARFVLRHSHLFNIAILCHGTELSRKRGGRAQEIYNNDYHWSYTVTLDGIRSGSLIVHGNTYLGKLPRGYGLQTYRLFNNYHSNWQAASGDNKWDVNVTERDGTHVDEHPPYLFESGTASGGSENAAAGLMSLSDSSKAWRTNQWAYYTAKRTSDNMIGQIISNTSNTLTMRYYTSDGDNHPTWRAGNRYQIHKVLVALDQPGRGRCDLISGADPPAAWPHQKLEPCYSWNNVHLPGGEHINFTPAASSSSTLLQGRDYYNDTPMPGYTPYTYPHPLTIGVQPAARATVGSPRYLDKNKGKKAKKIKKRKWAEPKKIKNVINGTCTKNI